MKVSTEIQIAAEKSKIFIEKLSLEQTKNIKKASIKNIFLWENLADFSVINNKDGWALISNFVEKKNCVMFFNDCDDKSVIKISNGEDLYNILYQTSGFEFYITNLDTEYLICFNHHDCLFGCGTAKEWVDSL